MAEVQGLLLRSLRRAQRSVPRASKTIFEAFPSHVISRRPAPCENSTRAHNSSSTGSIGQDCRIRGASPRRRRLRLVRSTVCRYLHQLIFWFWKDLESRILKSKKHRSGPQSFRRPDRLPNRRPLSVVAAAARPMQKRSPLGTRPKESRRSAPELIPNPVGASSL